MQVLKAEFLSLNLSELRLKRGLVQDIIINLIGFIPLGFFLSATVLRFGGIFERRNVLITAGVCFLVSLLIETIQVWMPSRSSQLMDLILNSLGALIGLHIYRILFSR